MRNTLRLRYPVSIFKRESRRLRRDLFEILLTWELQRRRITASCQLRVIPERAGERRAQKPCPPMATPRSIRSIWSFLFHSLLPFPLSFAISGDFPQFPERVSSPSRASRSVCFTSERPFKCVPRRAGRIRSAVPSLSPAKIRPVPVPYDKCKQTTSALQRSGLSYFIPSSAMYNMRYTYVIATNYVRR